MKFTIKAILAACLLIAALSFATGCAAEKTPYEINDDANYTVSIKYDANGGFFTTNTSVIVDSYNLSELQTSDGKAQIALLSPDDSRRGNDAFTAVNNGYFLAGWYTERKEAGSSDGKTEYVYSGKWDFEQDLLAVDAGKTYTSSKPVLTLYAAWVPMFEIEFYALGTDELLHTLTFDPTLDSEILLPVWDQTTGAIDMQDFPERKGYTFAGAYYDQEGMQLVDTAAVVHPGQVDYATGTAKDPTMKLYVDWLEGEWYHIYTAEQFLDNASVSGNYVIHADLDFTDKIWPSSLMHGNFTGTIQGNGHVLKNITLEQTNNSKVNSGLFGYLTEKASLSDLTFENVTFTIQSGTRVTGASFGLLAGTVSDQAAVTNVSVAGSTLQIDSGCYFGTEDYVIGLVCGMGTVDVDASGITCKAVGDKADSLQITVTDGVVALQFAD